MVMVQVLMIKKLFVRSPAACMHGIFEACLGNCVPTNVYLCTYKRIFNIQVFTRNGHSLIINELNHILDTYIHKHNTYIIITGKTRPN